MRRKEKRVLKATRSKSVSVAGPRVIWKSKTKAGTLAMVKVVLPWNSPRVYAVMFKGNGKRKFRVLFCGSDRGTAVAAYRAHRRSRGPEILNVAEL